MIAILNTILLIITAFYCVGLLLFTIGLFFPNRRRCKDTPSVSVIIAARNEEKNIAAILSDLSVQTYPADKYEIIVADDRSADRTSETVNRAAEYHPNIRLLKINKDVPGFTPKKNAVHQAIRHSRNEIILTTDADCRVLPTWIETMVSFFTPETGMVVGFSQLGNRREHQTFFERLQAVDFLSLMAAAHGALNLGWPLAASGQNLAYRRKAFNEVGGFSRIASRVSGDDVLLVQLIRKYTSWGIGFANTHDAFNTSQPESTLHAFINQRMRWASNGAYQWVLNKPFFIYVTATFIVNLGLFFSLPIGLFSENSILPFISLVLKFASEIILVTRGCKIYKRWDLLVHFPLWFILQIPYVLCVGILGTWGRFTWRGHSYKEKVPTV